MPETRVTVSTSIPPQTKVKAKGWIREAAKAGAEFHHKKHIPRHFQSGAATRYGYRGRGGKYQSLKKKITGQTLPLVFSGVTKREITGDRKITGTSTKGATLIMFASMKGLTSGRFRLKKNQRFLSEQQKNVIGIIAEIKAITDDEIQAIAREEEKVFSYLKTNNIDVSRKRPLV